MKIRIISMILCFAMVLGMTTVSIAKENEPTSVTMSKAYFEDFENADSLSAAGYESTANKNDSTTQTFVVGDANTNGKGIVCNADSNSQITKGPSGTPGFNFSADEFEYGGKSLEASMDVYVPAGVKANERVTPYLIFDDTSKNTIQCVSRFPDLYVNGGKLKFRTERATSASEDWGAKNGNGLWGANAIMASDEETFQIEHDSSAAKWVNLKIRLTYSKNAAGKKFYSTKYYIDNELVCDKDGKPVVLKLEQKDEPTKRAYIRFMIYGYSGDSATEKIVLDNLSLKLVDAELEIDSEVKDGCVTYSYNNSQKNSVDYQVIVASYHKTDGCLKNVYQGKSGSMAAGTFGEFEQDLSKFQKGETYKVFLWSGNNQLKPLTEALEMEIPTDLEKAEWITAPNIYSIADSKLIKGGSENALYRADSLTIWNDTLGKTEGAYEREEFVGLKMGAAPLLRKAFSTTEGKVVKKATAQVTGLGYYEVYMNGEKLGEKVLEPFTTLYDEDCVYYSEYDITDKIQNGENGVGAILGRGTYNISGDNALGMAAIKSGTTKAKGKQRFKMSMEIEYTDGTVEIIPTDTTWKASWSPIRYDQQAFGELYDARMEEQLGWSENGWSKNTFDDSSWENAQLEKDKDPKGELSLAPLNYNKVINTYRDLEVESRGNNTYRVDAGRVLTGWATLNNFIGVEGEKIQLHYIENPDTWNHTNSDYQSNKIAKFYYKDKDGAEQSVETYAQTDHYIMKEGINNWKPKFTLKSFRYIDITFPQDMTVSADDVKSMVAVEEVHANLEETGSFTSSNEIFNKTHDLAKKTLLNNMHSYISDTPLHENAPYLIDGVASAEWGIYNFDAENYLRKWLRDMRATQDGPEDEKAGRLNAIAPVGSLSMPGPEWSEGFTELTWALYQNTGKTEILRENYDNLKLLVQWETSVARKSEAEAAASGKLVNGSLPEYICDSTWGDHVPPTGLTINGKAHTAKRFTTLTATAFVYRNVVLVRDMAKILGKTEDVSELTTLAENIKKAFHENFWDDEKGYYHDAEVYKITSGGTDEFRQTPQIIAIKFGLVDEANKAGLLAKIKENIDLLQENGSSGFSTGVIGFKYIFDVLTENGMVDEVYEMFNTNAYPGYGYWLENGATSMWEYWEVGKRSDNHHMFGSIDKWFFRYLAGIQEETPGFQTANIKPYIPTGLTSASGSIETPYGTLSSQWNVGDNGEITLQVVVPEGTEANVYVPLKDNTKVIAPDTAVAVNTNETEFSVYKVSAGSYTFAATN